MKNPQRRAIARRAAARLVLAASVVLVGLTPALAGEASPKRAPKAVFEPAIEPARGEQCVADPAYMRLNHMDLLKHQRNETVHLGVRDPRFSLKGCIGCHASTATGSVAVAKTDFCVSCHSYAAVKVDCFECHSSKPQATAFLPLNHPHANTAVARLAMQWRQISASPTRPQ